MSEDNNTKTRTNGNPQPYVYVEHIYNSVVGLVQSEGKTKQTQHTCEEEASITKVLGSWSSSWPTQK